MQGAVAHPRRDVLRHEEGGQEEEEDEEGAHGLRFGARQPRAAQQRIDALEDEAAAAAHTVEAAGGGSQSASSASSAEAKTATSLLMATVITARSSARTAKEERTSHARPDCIILRPVGQPTVSATAGRRHLGDLACVAARRPAP